MVNDASHRASWSTKKVLPLHPDEVLELGRLCRQPYDVRRQVSST